MMESHNGMWAGMRHAQCAGGDDSPQESPWRAWARFLERTARHSRDGDGDAIASALIEALCARAGAVAASCLWRCSNGSSETVRAISSGFDDCDAALLVPEFDGAAACADEVRLHTVEADPILEGMLAKSRLHALGFRSSALVTVSDRQGRLFLSARCFFHADGSDLDLPRDTMLALAQHASCLLGGVDLERRLHDAAGRLASISDGVVDAIVTTDASGAVTSVNKAFSSMFGYSAQEILGRNVTALMPERYRAAHDHAMRWRSGHHRSPSRAIGRSRELEALRKDGSEFPIELALGDIEGGGGFVGVIRDTTERKAVEQRVRDADRMATIGRLAAGLGHDMNNMLFPIRAHLNALAAAHAADPSPRLREHADQIEHGVAHLQSLADTLHFLALDPEAGGDEGGVTDIAAWWRTSGALLSRALHRRAHLRPEIAEDLPPVAISQHALTRAVLNLLTNAADAMPVGRGADGSLVAVRVRQAASGACVVLEVADNGVGMSDEVRRRAGEMFFTTRPRGVGTGLGLAMVGRVVGDAGGRVEIDSAVGRGTTVRLLLPAVGAESDAGTVRIDLRDGRLRAVTNAVVESCGMCTADGDDPSPLAWVVDGSSIDAMRIEGWIRSHPRAPVVVLGDAPAEFLEAYGPRGLVHVGDVRDYRAIERALMGALEQQGQEISHG